MEGQVEPGADGDPVHLGDGRLRDLVEREPHPAEVVHLVELVARVLAGRREIRAGAEGRRRAGEDEHPVRVAVRDLPERLHQLVPHRAVDGVLLLGPVQGDGDDTGIRALDDQALHGFLRGSSDDGTPAGLSRQTRGAGIVAPGRRWTG
jgi:hypothetical protein